ASIAHWVRNPLGVSFNSVGSLRRIVKPQGDAALLLDIIGEEADRLNRMVGDLLDYSRPVQPALQPVPLRPLFEEAIESARQQSGDGTQRVAVTVRVAVVRRIVEHHGGTIELGRLSPGAEFKLRLPLEAENDPS